MAHLSGVDDRETLREMQALLQAVAAGAVPNRLEAVTYSRCRDRLLAKAGPDGLVPGFLVQCVSIYRFREFIGLYHPEAKARQGFVMRAFQRYRDALDMETGLDDFTGRRNSA